MLRHATSKPTTNSHHNEPDAPLNSNGPRAYSVTESRERMGGISRSTFYRKVEHGELQTRKLGSRTVVMAAELERYLNALPPSR